MGRYTTVQAFKDTDTRVPALSYELATGKVADKETGELVEKSPKSKEELYDEHGRKKGLTEKVVNAYGSTAGAGSGEYHTYRHARDRENRRLERNEQIKKKAEQKAEWELRLARNQEECNKKTEKRRKERKRKKEAKRLAKIRKEINAKAGFSDDTPKQKTGKTKISSATQEAGDKKRTKIVESVEPPRNKNLIPNDGSFLATFGKVA